MRGSRLSNCAFLAVVLTAGCGADTQAGERSAARQAAEPVRAQAVGSAGVMVRLPAGWHAATPNDGSVVDPVTRLVVASSPIRARGSECQVAAYAFDATAVAIVVVEWRTAPAALPERPDEFSTRELTIQAAPAIECFDGPGGTVQFVERGRSFGAYLLVGREATNVTIEQARRVLASIEVDDRHGGRELTRNGVSVAVPPGWDGRMLYREPSGRSGVIFQVANFELPANDRLEPPAVLPLGQEDPIKAMKQGDVLISVVADAPNGRPVRKPITLANLDPVSGPRVPHGHRVAAGSLCIGERCLEIQVDLGGKTMDAELERRVGDVLASVSVG